MVSLWKVFIFVYIIVSLVLVSESQDIKGLVGKLIPGPIKNLLGNKENNESSTTTDKTGGGSVEVGNKKEHGTLDSTGRDIVRDVTKVAKKVGKELGFISSNSSSGLDTDKSFFSGVVSAFSEKLKTIFPGTKWCGGGDIAHGYHDLGPFKETDSCCRNHDNCPDIIKSGKTKHGLQNTGLFTSCHGVVYGYHGVVYKQTLNSDDAIHIYSETADCSCDQKFHQCLKAVNTTISYDIGYTYFTLLGPQCFRKDYPAIDCKEKEEGKCVKYEFDKSGEQKYQWFDNAKF